MGFDYYFEIWLRGFAKDHLRSISSKCPQKYHPHITLVRPFNIKTSEEAIIQKVERYCFGKPILEFSLQGRGAFDNFFFYVPVNQSGSLLAFNDGIEKLLENDVHFADKLNDTKILHATVNYGKDINPAIHIEQQFLRLTAIRKKRIWFSYDFARQELLDREQSLDKGLWIGTVEQAAQMTEKRATRKGIVKFK